MYNTHAYAIYNPAVGVGNIEVRDTFTTFADFSEYQLVMGPQFEDASRVPRKGVRVDDRVAAMLIDQLPRKLLPQWLVDFDHAGMIRTRRVPLGNAAKKYFRAGDVDAEGVVLGAADAGWYYLWYRGLHLLCGDEGWRAGKYKCRPTDEQEMKEKFAFKKDFKAVIQPPPPY